MSERDGDKVAQILRDSILRLELRPGAILDEAELGARLNVSRTPVREAIIQLIADGHVVREKRQAKVAPLDFDDVPKLYDALLISSRLVHRLAAEHRSDADLAEIEMQLKAFDDAAHAGNGVMRSEANLAFHKAIARAASNRHIQAFYEQALVGTIRLSRACFTGDNELPNEELRAHLTETMHQHRMIADAIIARDVAESDRMAIEHYRITKARVMKVLFDRSAALRDMGDLSLDNWKTPVA